MLRKSPEERRPLLHRGESQKSHKSWNDCLHRL